MVCIRHQIRIACHEIKVGQLIREWTLEQKDYNIKRTDWVYSKSVPRWFFDPQENTEVMIKSKGSKMF